MNLFRSCLLSIRRFWWSLRYEGLRVTSMICVGKLASLLGIDLSKKSWYPWHKQRRFDERFGLDTAAFVHADSLDMDHDRKRHAIRYEPTPPMEFRYVLSKLDIRHRDYTFIDIGSGKGRVLLLASERPFKNIVGIELSQSLHKIAEENVRRYNSPNRRCDNIEPVCADATSFELPNKPLVIYFFNPFDAAIMEIVLQNIRVSLDRSPRHLVIVYHGPKQRHVLDKCGFLKQIRSDMNEQWIVYEANPHLCISDSNPSATVSASLQETASAV